MTSLNDFFIDPANLPYTFPGFVQLLFLLVAYDAYVLFQASNLISNGSELLLLVPSLAGIVGSVVLPILGAVPDAAIVLFSGLGDDAQEQLSVGVGALAGSTIMLLTLPWCLSVMAGRVSIEKDGNEQKLRYKKRPKLIPPEWGLKKTGVECGDNVRAGGLLMVITSISYLVIQGPAFFITSTDDTVIADAENRWALGGLVLCLVFFCGYLKYQWDLAQSDAEDSETSLDSKADEIRKKRIREGVLSFTALFYDEFEPFANDMEQAYVAEFKETFEDKLARARKESKSSGGSVTPEEGSPMKDGAKRIASEFTKLMQKKVAYKRLSETVISRELDYLPAKTRTRFEYFLRGFFTKYDADKSGTMDRQELQNLFRDLNENLDPTYNEIFEAFDTDQDGSISFPEFVRGAAQLVIQKGRRPGLLSNSGNTDEGGEDEEDSEETEDMPEDFKDLDPQAQQAALIKRSCIMMGLGTFLVLLFSDPMVDVLTELGDRTGVSSFYVSFVLAPLASNASELLASYNYALKKTSKTMAVSLSALEGAACMNNTFCLAVFMALIFIKKLAW
eukprot:CAMPEP_0117781324 /NCGR_PEP_ID=MMETSP0948-20121206/2772_1 /TAXON_ID=44440 /ORGANISM="Chattonella subsalsa, Strain CCMP2191" /LENGTH=561 /DNA_ID=CAMNT_0005609321 /DNA_START=9 /DNA_END=1692 /DNA_ORIENTATION=+